MCAGVPDFEMEVRPGRGSRIARFGEFIALFERKLVGRRIEIDAVLAGAVALFVDIFFDVAPEYGEVPVNGGRAVGVGDIDGPSVSAGG